MREAIKSALRLMPGGSRLLAKIQVANKYRSMRRQIAQRLCGLPILPGAVVVDLGAHVGFFSEHFLARGAVVHAYEPDPITFEELRRLKGRYADFHPHNCAVGAVAGTAPLFRHKEAALNHALNADSSSLLSDKANIGNDAILVRVESIDDVLAAHERIDVLKIDIEGAEYDIYGSVIRNIDRVGTVLMETHVGVLPSRRADHDKMLAEMELRGCTEKIMLNWF